MTQKTAEAKELSFADLGLDETILKAIEIKGFTAPTPIQVLAIPRLLDGDANVIAKARTGTGKTAAFGLPLVQELRSDNGHPRALVLVPTRELAIQVANEIESLRSGQFPRTVTVYGGASIVDQLRTLRRGVEIIVGTPGRVIDHLERGSLDLSKIEYFILDEADEMLNMGFIDDIEAIFGKANSDARSLMFSATMPSQILSIASSFLGDYEIVEEESRPEEPILTEQYWWQVREDDKTEALVRLIDSAHDFYGLVFCQTKADTDAVARELDERHYQAAALHGDIAQSQREKILGRFRNKKTRILVATDVAARGIDVEGLTHVINYALPFDGPTYTHRIGRTGRAGASGIAVTFVRPEERRRLGYLRHHARGEIKEGKIPSIDEVLTIKRERLMETTRIAVATYLPTTEGEIASRNFKTVPRELTAFAAELVKDRDAEAVLAAVLAVEYGREVSSEQYREIRQMRSTTLDRSHVRLYIGLGRRDGMTRRGIAQFFRDLLGIPERLVDRIEVMDAFSLATLPADAAVAALDLSKQRRNLPHLHVDVKDGGADFSSGPRTGRPRFTRGQEGNRGFESARSSGGLGSRGERGGTFDRGERQNRGSVNNYALQSMRSEERPVRTRATRPRGAKAYKQKSQD